MKAWEPEASRRRSWWRVDNQGGLLSCKCGVDLTLRDRSDFGLVSEGNWYFPRIQILWVDMFKVNRVCRKSITPYHPHGGRSTLHASLLKFLSALQQRHLLSCDPSRTGTPPGIAEQPRRLRRLGAEEHCCSLALLCSMGRRVIIRPSCSCLRRIWRPSSTFIIWHIKFSRKKLHPNRKITNEDYIILTSAYFISFYAAYSVDVKCFMEYFHIMNRNCLKIENGNI